MGAPVIADLIGQHFDKLEVVGVVRRTPSGTLWDCRCSCGNTRHAITSVLRRTQHIGCKACEKLSRSQSRIVHGGTSYGKSHLYKCWKSIQSRCTIPTDTNYRYYGAKGIKRCAEWGDFAEFRRWALANGYKQHLSIDRIEVRGDYDPSNCQWITRGENSLRMIADHRARRLMEAMLGG